MSLVDLSEKGDLDGVIAALQKGADVNTKNESKKTGLMKAVFNNHNLVVDLLLKTPNIDVNQKDEWGHSGLNWAVFSRNSDAFKLLLNIPNIDVNSEDDSRSAVYVAVFHDNVTALKLLLNHPSLTAATLNKEEKTTGDTPAMRAAKKNYGNGTVQCLALLAADLRVDLDTTDKEGRRLEEVARWQGCETCSCCQYQFLRYSGRQVIEEAKQRREEKKRQGI